MHPNPAFRTESLDRNIAFARARGFGTLAVAGEGPPLMSHIPFLLGEDGQRAELHLVRSNPICRVLPAPARLAVIGPDSNISPDWYGAEDQVPTWNYVAVHLTGTLEPLPLESLHDLLDRQSALFEDRLLPKPPWTSAKMREETMDRMMRAILPFVLHIEDISGTWKLNQNKPDAVRQSAANHVAEHGQGQEIAYLSALMRDIPSD